MDAYLTTEEAAAVARKHPVTIRLALEGRKLHGSQSSKGGRWVIREACLVEWIERGTCEHFATRGNVTPIRGTAA